MFPVLYTFSIGKRKSLDAIRSAFVLLVPLQHLQGMGLHYLSLKRIVWVSERKGAGKKPKGK